MECRLKIALLLIGALLAVPTVVGLSRPTTGQQPGKATGNILDAAHQRIPDVTVVIESKDGQFKQEIISDSDGHYEVELPTGQYVVTARKEGYRPPERKDVQINPGKVVNLDITFPPINDGCELPEIVGKAKPRKKRKGA